MKYLVIFLLLSLNLAENNPCDSDKYDFKTDIFPIIEKKCLFCHNDLKADGEINLKDYEHILPYAENGQLLGSVKHEEGFMPMPTFGGPLSECEVAKIQNWIENGARKE